MRRGLACALAAVSLVACGDPAPQPEANTAPIADDAANAAFRDLAARAQASPAVLTAAPERLDLLLSAQGEPAMVTVTNTTGPIATPKTIRLLPPTAPFSLTTGTCLRPLVDGEACTFQITPRPSAQPTTAAVLIEGDNFSALSITVDGRAGQVAASPSPETAAQRPAAAVDANAGIRAYYAAVALEQSPFAPAAGLAAPGVPVPMAYSPVPRAIVSPARDMRRCVSRNVNITLTLQKPLLATRKGKIEAIATYPVRGGLDLTGTRRPPQELLPQGTRFNGTFDSSDTLASRIILRFDSFEMGDGQTLAFLPMEGADAHGRAGTPAHVDHRYPERIIAALTGTLISVAPLFLVDETSTTTAGVLGTQTTKSTRQQAAEIASEDLRALLGELRREIIDTRPRAVVPEGSTIVVQPDADWCFPDPADPAQMAEWHASFLAAREKGAPTP